MKWNKLGTGLGSTLRRAAFGAAVSGALLFATACSRDYTVGYVYATSAGTQSVGAFGIDYQTGVLTQIAGSPFGGANGSVGRNPNYLVAHPSGKFLYVLSHDDSTVAEFAIGTDGKLYSQHTYNLTGSFGTSMAVDPAGSFLYVTYTYQNQYSTASPGPGGVTIFPIDNNSSDANYGALGTAINQNVGNNPVSVTVSPLTTSVIPSASVRLVYVLDQETSPNATVLGFQQASTGALTALTGTVCSTASPTTCTGYHAGVVPSSIVVDPTTRFVYVSDEYANQVIAYTIAAGAGNLIPLTTSPYAAGSFPVNMTVDPRGKYLLVANYNSNTVSSFTISAADGSLGGVASLGSSTTATGPSCVTIDPALGIYVYTSNRLDNSLTGLQMNANTGGLSSIPNTPFPTSTLPSCVTAVASGSHAQSIVNP